jgi:hypothetical protein
MPILILSDVNVELRSLGSLTVDGVVFALNFEEYGVFGGGEGAWYLSASSRDVSCGLEGRPRRVRWKRLPKRSRQAWIMERRKRRMKISMPTNCHRTSIFELTKKKGSTY